MVFNTTFNQQNSSYIVTDSGHSRHRKTTTKKNTIKTTHRKLKRWATRNHHKTGCEPMCSTT